MRTGVTCVSVLLGSLLCARETWAGDEDTFHFDGREVPLLDEMGFPEKRWMALRAGVATLVTIGPEDWQVLTGLRHTWVPYIWFDAQWLELSVLASAHYGSWGSRFNGNFTYELGGGASARLVDEGVFRMPLFVNVSFLHTPDGHAIGGRGQVGLSFRFLDMFHFDASADALRGVFKEDLADRDPQRWVGGFGVSASFDFCALNGMSWCNHDAPRVKRIDTSCQLYERANELINGPAKTGNLCDAVRAGLDTHENRQLDDDPMTAFFRGALLNADYDAAKILMSLRGLHQERRNALEAWRNEKRRAARLDVDLAENHQYAPYPVELEAALGCNDGADVDAEPMACEE